MKFIQHEYRKYTDYYTVVLDDNEIRQLLSYEEAQSLKNNSPELGTEISTEARRNEIAHERRGFEKMRDMVNNLFDCHAFLNPPKKEEETLQ